jgi:hypothetical protein
VGLAAALGVEAMASSAADRGRSRPRLRLSQGAFSLPILEQTAVSFLTPLRLDAALYEPAPVRRRGQIGRARIKGERLPNLWVVAQEPNTVWSPTLIANWYGSGERMVELASNTAVWYSTGLPAVPVRWVLVGDPKGGFKPQALCCCVPTSMPILR